MRAMWLSREQGGSDRFGREFFNGKSNADQWLTCDQFGFAESAKPQAHHD